MGMNEMEWHITFELVQGVVIGTMLRMEGPKHEEGGGGAASAEASAE